MTQNQISYWSYNEGRRSNKSKERETKRHNKATEGIERAKIALGYAQLEETKRNNDMNFVINKANQLIRQQEADQKQASTDETVRHNLVYEEIQRASVEETQRHNLAMESIQEASNEVDLMNATTNRAKAEVERIEAYTDTLKDLTQSFKNIADAMKSVANVLKAIG